jgi:diguanylate cyclase (GGDEF)-like protein
LLLDIDCFKNYNDRFGHAAGDSVLVELSRHLSLKLKKMVAIISRFGGEEFCVILTDVQKAEGYLVAEELRKSIEKMRVDLKGQETQITCSIGVAAYPADADSAEELIRRADASMYRAKREGRNRTVSA